MLEKHPIFKTIFFFIFSSLIPLSVFRYRSGSGSLSMRSRLKKHKRIEKGNAVRRRRGSRKSKTLTNRGNLKRKRTGKSNPMTLNQWEKTSLVFISIQ